MAFHNNPNFIHHQTNAPKSSLIREMVFGIEDGVVSIMGTVTGIAAGSQDHFVIVLSGFVLIAVEAISMAMGSYLSSKSEREIEERKLYEEKLELKRYPEEEKKELVDMYVYDGWPKKLAGEMAEIASRDKKLFLQEMAYRELKIIPENLEQPLHNGVAMGISYIIGGAVPLAPYLFTNSLTLALTCSIILALIGLFLLGCYTARFSKRVWWKAGFEMFLLASAAGVVGYLVGLGAEKLLR